MARWFLSLLIALLLPQVGLAVTIFEDDFDDGDANGWTFVGVNSGLWNVQSGELQSTSTQTDHVPRSDGDSPGAALIDGIVTPTHFSLEADVRVIGFAPNRDPGSGHVGFVWGWRDRDDTSNTYLRTHNDHVTSFSKPLTIEHRMDVPVAEIDVAYHLKIEVDHNAKVMTVTMDNVSMTFTGADFDEINPKQGGSIGLITWGERVGYDNVVLKDLTLQINTGLNDAWFNPATAGQGLFIIAFPSIPLIFAAWFTYDTERPDEDVTANLGEPGHRWITAQGPFEGNTAMLDVYVTAGGVFDSVEPKPDAAVKIGTMKIVWSDCNTGIISYDIPDLGLMDDVPIQRIALDNVALCEALSGQ